MDDNNTREQYRQFLRENAKAVSHWPEWMRAGARGESILQSKQSQDKTPQASSVSLKAAKASS